MTAHALSRSFAANGFLSQAASVFGANLMQAAVPFCSLLILGRRFGMDAAGEYALAQAITLPVFQLLSLQLKPLLLTRSPLECPLGAALYLRGLSSLLGIVFAGAAYTFFGGLALLLAGSRLVDSWSELTHAEWQRQGKAHWAFAVALLRGALAVGLLLIAASPELGLAMYLGASLFLLVLLESPREELEFHADGGELLRNGLLLGVVMSLLTLQAQAPRYALEHWSSRASLGLFATMTVLLQAGNLLASSFGQSLLPKLPEASMRQIARWTTLPALFGLAMAAPLVAFREPLARLLAPETPTEAANLLTYLAGVQVVVWPAATIGCALTAKRLYRPQLWIALGSNLIAAIAASLLVPRWGAPGAALAMGATSLSVLGFSFTALQLGGKR